MTSWADNVAAKNPRQVFILEFEGENKHGFDSTAGLSLTGAGANLTTSTTAKTGTASVSFDKVSSGSTLFAGITGAITAYDRSLDGTYDRIAVYLPDITDVERIAVILGSDASNYHRWDITNLVAGWNRPYLYEGTTQSGVAHSVVGSPDDANTDYILVSVRFNNTTDTLAGILVDWLTQHPRRYSTSRVTDPVAPTQQGVMKFPSIEADSYDIKSGRIDVGSATVPVVDPASADPVITDVSTFRYIGRDATIKMGFRGETESGTTYQPIYVGFVDTVPVKGREWSFGLLNVLDRLQVPFVTGATDDTPITLTSGLNIITHMLQVGLSTGNGTQGAYDTLSSGVGAAIPADYFDIAAIEQERDDWLPLDTGGGARFEQHEDNFLDWCFREIFLPYGIIPVVTLEGKFSVRVARPAYGAEVLEDIGDAEIALDSPVQFSLDRHTFVNRVTIQHSYDYVNDEFTEEFVEESEGVSNNCHCGINVPVPLTIQSRMIESSSVAARCAQRIHRRVSSAIPNVTVSVIPSLIGTSIGDVVTFTSTRGRVPDIQDGDYTIGTRLSEVVGRGYDPATNRLLLTASVVGFEQNNYRLIGPSSLTADYDAATAEERANYCFIADGSDTLGAAGDPAHVIGPG